MKRSWLVPILAIVVALVAAVWGAADAPCAAEDATVVLTYSVAALDGTAAPAAETIKATADIVAKRCAHAEFEHVTADVTKAGDRIEIRLPKSLAVSADAVRHLVERRGLVEFRLRARESVEDEQRDRRLQQDAAPPLGFVWCPDDQSVLQALVEMPEAPLVAKLDELLKRGPGDDIVNAARKEVIAALDKLRGESVFSNADIAKASVRWTMSTYGGQWLRHGSVRFEFREDRRAAFEKFTGDHVGRVLCVVVDGKVHVCPVINAAIPGMGELRAPGTGYTDADAHEMAAILECGPLPLKLVAEKAK